MSYGEAPPVFNAFLPGVTDCRFLYSDDFSKPGSGWPTADTGGILYEYRNGEYRILVRDPFIFSAATPLIVVSDYQAAVSVRNVNNKDGSYGILFGLVAGWSGFYTFEIDADSNFAVWRYSSGWSLLSSGSSNAIKKGTASNELAVVRQGSSMELFVNGTQVDSFVDGTFTGALNFGVTATSLDDSNLDIRFDNYVLLPVACGYAESMELPEPANPAFNPEPFQSWTEILDLRR